MANATTTSECMQLAYRNVNHWAGQSLPADNLRAHAILFLDAFAHLSDDDDNERTVRDWKVPSAFIAYRLPTAFNSQTYEWVNDVALVVYNASVAAYWAQVENRISAADAAAFVAAWNTAWGF